MESPLRVVVVDDHDSVREGVRSALNKHRDIELVGEADSLEEAVELVEKHRPDVLLLDMEIDSAPPRQDGVTVISKVLQCSPETRILVYSAHRKEGYILGALAEGAHGYILKTEKLPFVVDAIRGVGRGEGGWYSRAVMDRIARSKKSGHEPTRQELQILKRLDLSNKEIAKELGIAPNTVKKHVSSILAKLNIPSRGAAIVKAMKMGLISQDDEP